jgi:hypothetical protein
MKTKSPPVQKAPREPRIDCRATNYSQAALDMMERATGQRLTRLPVLVKAPTVAVDAD